MKVYSTNDFIVIDPIQDPNFDQTFNEMDYVNNFTLEPHETKNLIFVLTPPSLTDEFVQYDANPTVFTNLILI